MEDDKTGPLEHPKLANEISLRSICYEIFLTILFSWEDFKIRINRHGWFSFDFPVYFGFKELYRRIYQLAFPSRKVAKDFTVLYV